MWGRTVRVHQLHLSFDMPSTRTHTHTHTHSGAGPSAFQAMCSSPAESWSACASPPPAPRTRYVQRVSPSLPRHAKPPTRARQRRADCAASSWCGQSSAPPLLTQSHDTETRTGAAPQPGQAIPFSGQQGPARNLRARAQARAGNIQARRLGQTASGGRAGDGSTSQESLERGRARVAALARVGLGSRGQDGPPRRDGPTPSDPDDPRESAGPGPGASCTDGPGASRPPSCGGAAGARAAARRKGAWPRGRVAQARRAPSPAARRGWPGRGRVTLTVSARGRQ